MSDVKPVVPPKRLVRKVRELKCYDPFCACDGRHTCVTDCKSAAACTCWACCLCKQMSPANETTVTAAGNPCGECCAWRLDDEGNVIYRADGTPK